jgi:hypothetical protein
VTGDSDKVDERIFVAELFFFRNPGGDESVANPASQAPISLQTLTI